MRSCSPAGRRGVNDADDAHYATTQGSARCTDGRDARATQRHAELARMPLGVIEIIIG
jgi:hypothetical protein